MGCTKGSLKDIRIMVVSKVLVVAAVVVAAVVVAAVVVAAVGEDGGMGEDAGEDVGEGDGGEGGGSDDTVEEGGGRVAVDGVGVAAEEVGDMAVALPRVLLFFGVCLVALVSFFVCFVPVLFSNVDSRERFGFFRCRMPLLASFFCSTTSCAVLSFVSSSFPCSLSVLSSSW